MSKKIKEIEGTEIEIDVCQNSEAEDLLQQIEAAETWCQDTAREMDICHRKYKGAKESYEEAVEELRRLCRVRSETNPLLDAAKGATPARRA